MKEKVGNGSVMECVDFMVLVCLMMAYGSTVVFAQKRQELNGRCIHVSECNRVGYFCSSNRTCQCAPGYTSDEKRKKCIGYVGSRCVYDSQCIEGAYCTGIEGREKCRCREQDDFFPSEDDRTCISSATILNQKSSVLLITLMITWTLLYLNT